MPSFASVLAAASLCASLAIAQSNYSSIPAIVAEVGPGTCLSWCVEQRTTCGQLCGGQTDSNNCTSTDLTYSCLCSSNHSSPAPQYYLGTIDTFVCNQALGDCLKSTAGDAASQDNCKTSIVCGAANASSISAAGSSTTAAASSTAAPTGSSTSVAAASPTASKGAAAMAVAIGQDYGLAVLGAGLLAAMGLVL